MERLPFGYAVRATRMISLDTGQIACGVSDIDLLLSSLPFLASPFLHRQVHRDTPVVSKVDMSQLLRRA